MLKKRFDFRLDSPLVIPSIATLVPGLLRYKSSHKSRGLHCDDAKIKMSARRNSAFTNKRFTHVPTTVHHCADDAGNCFAYINSSIQIRSYSEKKRSIYYFRIATCKKDRLAA